MRWNQVFSCAPALIAVVVTSNASAQEAEEQARQVAADSVAAEPGASETEEKAPPSEASAPERDAEEQTRPAEEQASAETTSTESKSAPARPAEPDEQSAEPPQAEPTRVEGKSESTAASDESDASSPAEAAARARGEEDPDAPSKKGLLEKLNVSFKVTGMIKPTIIIGDGIESYERANATAPTAAVNPVFSENPDRIGTSFQAQQTRFGIVAKAGTVTGKIEVDFIDFNQSSPTTTVHPRLRIAEVDWQVTPSTVVELGQTWDLVAPLNPHSYNLVGAFFRAGNSAFMRHQIRVRQTVGDFELGAGIASAAPSNATPWGNTELGTLPAVNARIQYQPTKELKLGISGLAVRLRFAPEVFDTSYHGALHLQYKTKNLDLRFESYLSHDGANTGLLNLSQGRFDGSDVVSLDDAGGFISAMGRLNPVVSLYGSVGGAAVLNPSDVPTAVVRDADGNASRNGIGIKYNAQARIGGRFDINDFTFLYAEPYGYLTRHQLSGQDAEDFDEQRIAYGLEAGALMHF